MRLARFGAAALLALAAPAPLANPAGAQAKQGIDPAWVALPRGADQILADHRRINEGLAALQPQRSGVVDAYVIAAALDADAVFNREAREAGRVLARRFDAVGRTIVLAEDEGGDRAAAAGSPEHLAMALARAAELMDKREDVLVLYVTSHGMPNAGIAYKDMNRGVGMVTPALLDRMMGSLAVRNRLIILQACFAGQFVPSLAGPTTIVATAAAADRSSFGCSAGNDWTYFGDALINRALRHPAPLETQLRAAGRLVAAWEARDSLEPSKPQLSIGAATKDWLDPLEARAPTTATDSIGRSPAAGG